MFKIDLRRLILLLTILTSLFTLWHTFWGNHQAQRSLLLQHSLESNHAYAKKLAQSTNRFLESLQHQVAYSAAIIQRNIHDHDTLQSEVIRLQEQSHSFNSVVVASHNALGLATAPVSLGLQGRLIYSEGARQALLFKRPLISQPYVSNTGRLMLFISHPLFDEDGDYLGFLGGSIYLRADNSLNALLGEHFNQDGSEVYVLDQSGQIIYHQNRQLIGETLSEDNPIMDATLPISGAQQLVTPLGDDVLLGYASVDTLNWKVIAQRPTQVALNKLNTLLRQNILSALPFLLLLIIALWYLTKLIATPLHQLAKVASDWDTEDVGRRIQQINSWYFEASQIQKGMLVGLGLLNKKLTVLDEERLTDPLTSLRNRRSMLLTASAWMEQNRQFVLITCDIDDFKYVNDNYGHAMGDEVLVFLAQRLQALSRPNDEVCRIGGEEFLLMLPSLNLENGARIAERLRADIANTPSPMGKAITISIGVSQWNSAQESFDSTLMAADKALYRAKNQGGNRVEVASP